MWCMVLIWFLWIAPVALGLEVDEARHLLARTSFGGTPAEMTALQPLSYAAAVDQLLNGVRQQPRTAPPTCGWMSLHRPPGASCDE